MPHAESCILLLCVCYISMYIQLRQSSTCKFIVPQRRERKLLFYTSLTCGLSPHELFWVSLNTLTWQTSTTWQDKNKIASQDAFEEKKITEREKEVITLLTEIRQSDVAIGPFVAWRLPPFVTAEMKDILRDTQVNWSTFSSWIANCVSPASESVMTF